MRRPRAPEDAEENTDYIAKDSLQAAIRLLENVESTLVDLAASPNSGSPFESADPRLANLRIRQVGGFPRHLVFYEAKSGVIEVVRILHGSRDLDRELGND